MKKFIPDTIEEYARRHSLPPTPVLMELEAYTREHCELPQMLVGNLEGALLRLLVQLTNARNILEIGCFTGYSALVMAQALPEDGRILTCEIKTEHADIAQGFFDKSEVGQKITLSRGPALDTLRKLDPETVFDMVFIDADKENYSNYYDVIMPHVKTGGLIVADNVLWSGAVLNPKEETDHALVAFNEKVRLDENVEQVMLTVRDGVMLIRKTA